MDKIAEIAGKALGLAIWVIIGAGIGAVAASITALPAKIDRLTDTYLCIEAGKLGVNSTACDRFLKGE